MAFETIRPRNGDTSGARGRESANIFGSGKVSYIEYGARAQVWCASNAISIFGRCCDYVHNQPARRGHELGPFQRPDKPITPSSRRAGVKSKIPARKSAADARSLPDCARRAKGLVKNMTCLKEKVIYPASSRMGGNLFETFADCDGIWTFGFVESVKAHGVSRRWSKILPESAEWRHHANTVKALPSTNHRAINAAE